jgi:hypothetical protein
MGFDRQAVRRMRSTDEWQGRNTKLYQRRMVEPGERVMAKLLVLGRWRQFVITVT